MSNFTNSKTEWDLTKYYYASIETPEITKDFETVKTEVEVFKNKYKGKIASLSAGEIAQMFEMDQAISILINKILLFLFYKSSLESQNQEILKKQSEYERQTLELINQLLFVNEEFKNLGVEKLLKLSETETLKQYSNYLVQKANNLKYLLDEKTESILNLKQTSGISGFIKLLDEFHGALKFEIELDDKIKVLTEEEIRTLRQNPKEEIRQKAFESIAKTYLEPQNQMVLGNIYANVVKNATSEVTIRGFKTVMSSKNISEELSDEIVDTLMQVVSENFPIYHQFLDTKLKILKAKNQNQKNDKLEEYNVFAPISDTEPHFELNMALEIYFEAMSKFDSEFVDFAKEMFESGRVDVYPKFGKRGGAYACYEKNHPSFVLLNFTNTLRDVSTIAHELGHAIHGHFSQKQPEQTYSTGMSLAETASVFSETLFMSELSKNLDSDLQKLELLNNQLDDIFATIFRQIMYVNFEKEVHTEFLNGKELAYTDFNLLWRKHSRALYGNNFEFINEDNQDYRWSGIPHIFHTPFYCYSYAFGNLLSFALYQKYLTEGKSFIPKYKEILSSGGSQTPYNLLINYDIDISKKEFFTSGLNYVKTLVDKYSELAKKIYS